MPAHLLSLTDGPSILIDKPILLFGRHAECDVQLNSKKVSRRHCAIAQVNDYLVVRDLGSTNGVRINGKRVVEGKLQPGDEVTIGNFRYQVCGDVLGRPEPHLPEEVREAKKEAAERRGE
jgi:pSer/pThr/pTyr-binding forkhead associated (FHA) protein